MLDTRELISARRKEQLNEVQLGELLDVPNEIHLLIKTATEKSIILKIEKEIQEKEELRRQEHKVYEWSSHHESNAQNNGDSYIMDNTPEENHSGSADTASDPKLRRLFSNGAMNILDQKLPKIGKAIVGEIYTPEQRNMPLD